MFLPFRMLDNTNCDIKIKEEKIGDFCEIENLNENAIGEQQNGLVKRNTSEKSSCHLNSIKAEKNAAFHIELKEENLNDVISQTSEQDPLSIGNSNIDDLKLQKNPSTFNEKKKLNEMPSVSKNGKFTYARETVTVYRTSTNVKDSQVFISTNIDDMKLRKCCYCEKFIPIKNLKCHITAHKNIRNILHFTTIKKGLEKRKIEEQKCNYCEKKFAKHSLKRHISSRHTCNVCMKYFKDTKDLNKHIFNGHKEDQN